MEIITTSHINCNEIQKISMVSYGRCKLFGILHPSASVMSTVPGSRFIQSPSRLSDVRTVTPMVPHTTPQPSVSRKVRLKSFFPQKLSECMWSNIVKAHGMKEYSFSDLNES